MTKTAITPTRSEDYAEWYQQVVRAGDLAGYIDPPDLRDTRKGNRHRSAGRLHPEGQVPQLFEGIRHIVPELHAHEEVLPVRGDPDRCRFGPTVLGERRQQDVLGLGHLVERDSHASNLA